MANPSDHPLDLGSGNPSQIIAWEANEFVHREKGFGWLVLIWLGGFLLAAGAILYYRVTIIGIASALVAVAAALALTTQGRVKPKTLRVGFDGTGAIIGNDVIPWSELKSFWFHVSSTQQVVYLETTRRMFSIVPIQLGNIEPETVRNLLLEHLPEKVDQREELSDRLARLIKF